MVFVSRKTKGIGIEASISTQRPSSCIIHFKTFWITTLHGAFPPLYHRIAADTGMENRCFAA